MNTSRPCFLSHAQEREFETLVRYAKGCIDGCGEEHARGAIEALVPLSHDVDAILRCAKAEGRTNG
ncbi:Putative uncharacterized protein (plasmid) [Mesorhizobium loti]|uniref:hypothetical protein n=1 Tax=Mesorhizobium sp. 131-2-5 TaxID=2744519 RepID=UPI0008199902|nr:hypothetical protein [Mesorhizobium sp. 131-2-5]BAV52545.1 Putative uncharacterized protein [Mesorhizobium loti]BCH05100.1 hypothetical protein MesoLj131b_70990 [Mesorhizobium sp. 131-2-5]